MEPGLELNQLIADKIFHGFTGHFGIDENGAEYMRLPRYSAELGAAWEIIVKLDRVVEIRWHPKASQKAIVMIGVYDPPGGVGTADTLPLAICRAALDTVERRKP